MSDTELRDRPGLSPVETDLSDEIDLLALMRTLWLGKWWIVLAVVVAGAVGYGYLRYLTVPKYTAEAVVALENRQSNVTDLTSVMSGLSGDQATINTETEVLRSRRLIGQLVDKLDLTADPEFNRSLTSEDAPPPEEVVHDATVNAVLSAISVSNVRSSYVYKITVITTAPKKSQALANTLADLYIQDQLSVKFEATAQATAWLTKRVASLKTELEAAEDKVQNFTASTTLVSPDALEGMNRQIKETRARLDDLSATRDSRAAQVSALEAAKATGDRAAMLKAAGVSALERIAGEASDSAAFDARFAAVLDLAHVSLSRVQTQIDGLNASIATLEADFSRQSKDLVALEQLKREAEASQTIYGYFLTRLKETSVQAGIQQPDSRVLSSAALPTHASAPRKSRTMALALLLGMIVGAGGVLLREMLHSGFRTADELEQATGVTVMGQLPRVPVKSRLAVIEYLIEKPTSAAAEAVRNLRTSLLYSNIDHPPQVILSTSAVPGEGKTTTAIALAQNFTGLGKSVLLVEGDLRRRVFSEYFDLGDVKGLLSILSGEARFEDVVQPLELIGADVLFGENSTANAADVFSSDRFKDFITDMRQRYDAVIIDAPPVLLVPDARILAHEVDAVLFTVKWDSTTRSQVAESVRQFEIAGRPVTGLVLGQVDPKGMKRYGYSESYGAYASYGSHYYNS